MKKRASTSDDNIHGACELITLTVALFVNVMLAAGCFTPERAQSELREQAHVAATIPTTRPAPIAHAIVVDADPFECRMWGVTPSRNMVSPGRNPPVTWDVETGANILWSAQLGSKAYGEPIVADGVVYVGTNNEAAYDKRHTNADGSAIDGGVLMAFDAETGAFLWQRYSAKLASGRVNDWPGEGVCSAAYVEHGRLWYATNRCEVVCLDVSAGRNQRSEPKVIWSFDMMKELAVFPHNMTRSHIVAYKDLIYVVTGNGVDDTHKHVVAPAAPSLVCFDKSTGKVVWSDASPSANILHGTWGIISLADVHGRALVIAPQGDGWVRAFDAETGKKIWSFDTNPKDSIYPQTRNELLSAAAIVGNRMYIGNGQDPEHGTGYGHFWCVRIDGAGDVSAELAADVHAPGEDWFALVNAGGQAPRKRVGVPNPNSAVVWHYDRGGGVKKTPEVDRMHRTMSTAAVYGGLVFIPDFSGYVHCFDARTGRKCWSVDLESPDIWSAPLIIDGKLYIGDGGGIVHVFAAAEEMKKLATNQMESAVYTTPTYANHTLYLLSMHKLYAIRESFKGDSTQGEVKGSIMKRSTSAHRVIVAFCLFAAGFSFAAADAVPAQPTAKAPPATQPATAPSTRPAATAVPLRPYPVQRPDAARPLDFKVTSIDGQERDLRAYEGYVILLVNTASRCGLTPQYAAMQRLYDRYHDHKFVILAFPSNDFLHQEPGTDQEILKFVTERYHVTFPMMSKIVVKGKDQHPLYVFLTSKENGGAYAGDVEWNFAKFLLGKDGKVAGRFPAKLSPEDPKVLEAIEKALNLTPAQLADLPPLPKPATRPTTAPATHP